MARVPISNAHIRIARPTNDIAGVKKFYQDGLGFEIVFDFENHDGFDGVMLGLASHPYHLEFTKKIDHEAPRAPSQDNLLVFYIPDEKVWASAVARMEASGFSPVPAYNSYWDRVGKTFEDSEGYRIVFQNADWTNKPQSLEELKSIR